MTRWLLAFVVATLGTLTGAARLQAQLAPEKALAALKVADGLQVELFAHEPMLINPTSMDVDHRGRVWVCEAVNYRRKNFNRPIIRPEGDRIVILTDKDGDGKADDSTVFYQGPDLIAPLGIAIAPLASRGGNATGDAKNPPVHTGGSPCQVFVCQSPDILLFHDKDGDGKADGKPEKFLTGFGGFDHDHGVHSILIGPDGKLYFTVGDAGVTGLQSRDGKGKKWVTTKDPKGDCQAGTVWRCDFDGTHLELIAHNFRNNYECCVDSFGEIWLSDNDDDGNQQTRICHVMPGGNYGYWPRGPGQTHWHEEQPGVVHKTLRTGFGSPTGICFYEGNLLPEKYRGHLLHTDAGPRELRCFHRKPKGAGYELDTTVMLTSSDNWFRPSDVCVAPDGSVFVADWYDRGVGGHGMGDPTDGRIYRLTPKGHTGYKVPAGKLDSPEGFASALESPCLATRHMAYVTVRPLILKVADELKNRAKNKEKAENDPKTSAAAERLNVYTKSFKLEDQSAVIAARYLLVWCVSNKGGWNPTPLYRAAGASDVFLEEGRGGPIPPTLLRIDRDLGDNELFSQVRAALTMDPDTFFSVYNPSPAVQRELLLTARNLDSNVAKPVFYALAKKYDGQDHFYRAALNIACGTDPARRDAILADFDKHFPEWNDKVADLVWELRPKSVLPRLAKLMDDPKLTAAQKGRIVDILAVNDDPAAGNAMLQILSGDAAADVKARAIENLRLFLPTKWKDIAKGDEVRAVVGLLLGEATTHATGLRLVAAAQFEPALGVVAATAADPNRPTDLRREAVRTLAAFKAPKAIDALAKLTTDDTLQFDAVKALGAIRTDPSLTPLKALVQDSKLPPDLRREAVAALAASPNGTRWLLGEHRRKFLPADLVADAGRLLRNSPFQGERNQALLLFPVPARLDLKKLPSVAELAKRKGDAASGQQLLAKSLTGEGQCLKCHTVRGLGGQIGPDLSMIGKKGSRENLFESILQPSKAIADQSVSWKIDTTDGQSITGLLVQETPKVVTLRDANGKDHDIAVGDIEKRSKSLVSLMPDNLAAVFTEDELVDVVEYMTTLQTPALTPESWHVVGPFRSAGGKLGLDTGYGPESAAFDVKATFPETPIAYGQKPKDLGWRVVRPGAGAYVDLATLHGAAANNSVSFAFKEVESPADQDATILLGTDDGAKLYVNGETVFETNAVRAAAPGQDTVTVKLKKGANAVLLKIANGNNPHGFYLTILSGQELKAK